MNYCAACAYVYVASFPGSHAPEREIEVVYIRVPGEPGNEANVYVHATSAASAPGRPASRIPRIDANVLGVDATNFGLRPNANAKKNSWIF